MKKLLVLLAALMVAGSSFSQQRLTKEQILAMSTDELSELPLEDLMQAVETLGVASVDELFALIMNKNVSSASKEEEDTFTSPLSSTVITRDEMRTYGVSTIEEALRLIPGMIVTEKSNGVYDIQMRGLNNIPDNNMLFYTENSNTLMMVDGRPVYNYTMGAISFDMMPIDIEDVERIEVVRGASGALYGANAVTGVINIITTKPDNSKATVSGNVQIGNQNTMIANAAIRKPVNDKLALGLTFNMQRRHRATSQLYILPSSGVVYSSDNNLSSGTELSLAELGKMMQVDQTLSYYQEGGYLDADKVNNLKQLFPWQYDADGNATSYMVYDVLEPEVSVSKMFPDPSLSRRTMGINGYVSFTPAEGIRFDLSGGYQQGFVNTTPCGSNCFSINNRETKTGYVALSAEIKGFNILANYAGGPIDFAVGIPGFKELTNNFNASIEYDLHVGDLGIRPGVAFQRIYYKDYVPDYDNKDENGVLSNYDWSYRGTDYRYADNDYNHLSGFFNYDAEMTTIAPSVRLDYKLNNFRFVGAYRADKTNIPDKWNHSWQFSASCEINDANFVRLTYGRANRSAVLVNTNSDFTWTRSNLMAPNHVSFVNDQNANLMSIDNVEIGYRVKPSTRLLIDAEAFYSRSRDYGALMAHAATFWISYQKAASYLSSALSDLSNLSNDVKSIGEIQYGNLPYEVSQCGFGVNADWIISSKLIAKFNLNLQKTTIDNYYPYSETKTLESLLYGSKNKFTSVVADFVSKLADVPADQLMTVIMQALQMYGVQSDDEQQRYVLATTPADDPNNNAKTQDNFENKATPHFYGMIGLVYKPLPQLNVSAFTNYIGKRSYITKYNSNYVVVPDGVEPSYNENGTDLSQRFTVNLHVGYKPVETCEFFFNAHNLLNNRKREFVYADEIGGLYSVGVNFEF